MTKRWVGTPNERTSFRIHDAVVGFVDRCLSRTRNLAAFSKSSVFSQADFDLPRNSGAIILSACLLVCLSCVTFVVFTECESCTRPISINPESMDAGEYGLTRGTGFVACRLEAVAAAGLLWISSCVSDAAGFITFFLSLFFSSNAQGLLQV